MADKAIRATDGRLRKGRGRVVLELATGQGPVRRSLEPGQAQALGAALLRMAEELHREAATGQRQEFADGFALWYLPAAREGRGAGWYVQAPSGGTLGPSPTRAVAEEDLAGMRAEAAGT